MGFEENAGEKSLHQMKNPFIIEGIEKLCFQIAEKRRFQ